MFRRKGVQKLWGKCLKLHLVLLERSLWSKLLSGIAFTANKSLYSTSKLNILNILNGSKDPKENNKRNILGGVLFQIYLFWEQHRGKKAAKDCLSTFKRLPLLEIHFKSCFSRALFHEYLQTITSNQLDGVLKIPST